MDTYVLAKRHVLAQNRIMETVTAIAEVSGMTPPAFPSRSVGGPDVARLLRQEAIADFLEQLAAKLQEQAAPTPIQAATRSRATKGA